MREKPNIPDELLRACLQEHYDISAVSLHFLPLGLDRLAGVYRVVNEQGASYLLKVKAGLLYEPSCFIPRYLADQGLATVVAPLPTRGNVLWTQLGDWTVLVYSFIEGITGWQPELSDTHWKAVGMTLKQIHQFKLPSEGFQSVRKETFDPTEYFEWINTFETQQTGCGGGSRNEGTLRSSWLAHQPTIHTLTTSMEKLAKMLQLQSGPQVICHADLHPGNLIRAQTDQVFVIDWDDVMLAPKERDFLFVREGNADDSALPETSPFFRGMGRPR